MSVVDASQRLTALDPLRSFCVGAPAGSGKTELLIQRYLTLLARVDKPEQVLAITFTRKAAAEMRDRVLESLLQAQRNEPCSSPHQQQTRDLALQALAADHRASWQLVRNINRLNIKTIDSFCSQLTRQMPVLSEFGGQAEVVDNAADLYREAVVELFKIIDSEEPLREHLFALMLHFDNDWARLEELLTVMLARRDQWRAYTGVHQRPDAAQAHLLRTVEGIVRDALTQLSEKLRPHRAGILALQQYAADNLGGVSVERFPEPTAVDLTLWRGVRDLLLTADKKKPKWRASFNVKMGFPPGKGEASERKQELKLIIGELTEVEGLLEELATITTLPEIASQSASWQLVLHLSRILPRLAAELLLVFQRHGKVDYSQVSLSALQALGEDELPTELAMRLDYQLEHILVDEFQDTAINQFDLVRRLTRGWGEHNEHFPERPRTLLIVGDGMQSIYGFRDANVGLFLHARKHGFNGVGLEYLSLESNFRSDQGVVQWVNATFAEAFPDTEDVSKGQIRFTQAVAVRKAGEQPAVSIQGFSGEASEELEIESICAEVQRGIADQDCKSIAILARTRGHLQPILTRFKELGIVYSAADIDSLASSSVIMDLLALCAALRNSADRVAWMAVLRAPWCGLELKDLHVIGTAGEFPAHTPVASLLRQAEILAQLSSEGRERITHVAIAMSRANQMRDRLALRLWVEQLWLDLGGPATAPSDNQLQDAERFFRLLEQAEYEGLGLSLSWLQNKLEKLYIQAENPSSKIQVMTLHKAKGLEFDRVIIPSLQKITRGNTRPLMLWDDYSNAAGERGFLLAADDHSKDDEPTLYNWLKAQRANKEILETTRLLYVGATRAVQRLVLTACLNYDDKKGEFRPPPERSLLARIWPGFREQMTVRESSPLVESAPVVATAERAFYRLPQEVVSQMLHSREAEQAEVEIAAGHKADRFATRVDRYVGTVVHIALEQLSKLQVLPQAPAPLDNLRWHLVLARMGLFGEQLEYASRRVDQSVAGVLADVDGRWILSSKHLEAHSELPLSSVDDSGQVLDLIIDRTFVDGETSERWLIDYKNSEPHDGETVAEFTQREAHNYRAQLSQYAQALETLNGQPVNCALYFTALTHLHRVDIRVAGDS